MFLKSKNKSGKITGIANWTQFLHRMPVIEHKYEQNKMERNV